MECQDNFAQDVWHLTISTTHIQRYTLHTRVNRFKMLSVANLLNVLSKWFKAALIRIVSMLIFLLFFLSYTPFHLNKIFNNILPAVCQPNFMSHFHVGHCCKYLNACLSHDICIRMLSALSVWWNFLIDMTCNNFANVAKNGFSVTTGHCKGSRV